MACVMSVQALTRSLCQGSTLTLQNVTAVLPFILKADEGYVV